ncbi:hypothetical protein ASF70_18830 [Rhizobium sp. Leaf321]|jgi:hypothetical protein|uniref:hypothetical protein n=1 Tax=Rhizobium sp. Leaf321 TaxID=1736335 RepID=UPI000712B770|nr:hypothetical protein [Rhizobium sp. Leaf321]KQQ70904.1 hypothetical protein ASF70_18830 [Rhizobium sp. Leaf321]
MFGWKKLTHLDDRHSFPVAVLLRVLQIALDVAIPIALLLYASTWFFSNAQVTQFCEEFCSQDMSQLILRIYPN